MAEAWFKSIKILIGYEIQDHFVYVYIKILLINFFLFSLDCVKCQHKRKSTLWNEHAWAKLNEKTIFFKRERETQLAIDFCLYILYTEAEICRCELPDRQKTAKVRIARSFIFLLLLLLLLLLLFTATLFALTFHVFEAHFFRTTNIISVWLGSVVMMCLW